ncbi:hypothetical protein ACEQ8H_000969 [Pleosporales sp. CAS-2024a]
MGAMCFTALSMIGLLQALLHNKNITTVVMLTAISLWTSDLLCLLFGYASWSRCELLRICLLLLACVGILVAEYHLLAKGLLSSIPTMLFAGLARALKIAAGQSSSRSHVPLAHRQIFPMEDIQQPDEKDDHETASAAFKDALTLLVVVAVTASCSALAPDFHVKSANLDHAYTPSTPLEVVLSMYHEPPVDVWNLIAGIKSVQATRKASVIIYTKDKEADVQNLRLRTGADKVITLDNVGRESETYLHHINTRWDSLAKHTVFLQADVHFDRDFDMRLGNYFDVDRTGFLNLGAAAVCECDSCSDRDFWHDNFHLFPRLHYDIYNSTDCKNVLIGFKASFIVSAARIRGINKNIYKRLWQAVTDKDSWAHRPDFSLHRPDSMNAPDLGYTLERMWNLLFQCSDMNVGWKCPSLTSGWRIGGDIADCQCFDDVPS